jgi:hypothetical protein
MFVIFLLKYFINSGAKDGRRIVSTKALFDQHSRRHWPPTYHLLGVKIDGCFCGLLKRFF